jgi:Flp pilus assembly secretin CpaC
LALVGKQEGQTDMMIWLEGEPAAKQYRVVVGRGDAIQPNQDKLERLLAEMFPQSHVTLSQRDDRVQVNGTAKSRQEAIQILSVVRSVKLIPVVDNLQLQRR